MVLVELQNNITFPAGILGYTSELTYNPPGGSSSCNLCDLDGTYPNGTKGLGNFKFGHYNPADSEWELCQLHNDYYHNQPKVTSSIQRSFALKRRFKPIFTVRLIYDLLPDCFVCLGRILQPFQLVR